jgi:TPR repeat protein
MKMIDERRTVDAAQKLMLIAMRLANIEGDEVRAECQVALRDAWTLLQRVPNDLDAMRLKGIVKAFQGKLSEAIDLLYDAFRAGDLTALVRLEALLREENRNGEADQIATRIRSEMDRGNGDVLWSLFRDAEVSTLDESEDTLRLITRATAAGNEEAAVFLSLAELDQGDPHALSRFREIASSPDAAASLGRFLSRFDLSDGVYAEGDTSESQRLLRMAHEQGSLEATVLLWFTTEAPDDQEFADVLDRYFIGEERAKHLAAMYAGGAGSAISQVALAVAEDEHQLVALRLLQAGAAMGFDGAVSQFGALLQSEADNQGPWAVLGAFLGSWPQMIRDDLVGSPNFPLGVVSRAPALRDDHSAALATGESDFARRIQEVLEQVGWTMHELGDHLLVGYWRVESGPIQIYIEISGGMDQDRFAHISTPLLVGLDGETPPWDAPALRDVDVDGWDLFLDDDFRASITDLGAFTDTYTHPQRRVLEALFRLGENESREYYLEPMGFLGMSLGGMLGRRMTFDGAPERLYPQAWASASLCDYISTGLIHEVPELHRCVEPLAVLTVGYTMSADLSGGHLRGVIGGTVHSLMVMQDYVTKMFDDEPAIFNEIFNAVPMTRILDHRDLFHGEVPDLEAAVTGSGFKAHEALAAIKERRHELISDPNADAMDINNAAWQLMQEGFMEEAMVGFDRAASMGQPNALATLLWQLMLAEQPEQAVAAYEHYFPLLNSWMADQDDFIQEEVYPQIANCKSNAAIAYVAIDQIHTALRLWQEAAAEDHIEAKAYPAVLAARDGDTRRAKKIMKKLTDPERTAFREDMEQVLGEGSGWFEIWARDALELLDRV